MWFVIVLVILFIVVVVALSYVSRGWQNVETERITFFSVEPNFICPSRSCVVDINYEVKTTHDNTQVSLQVIGPNGTIRDLASSLTFAQSSNGADTGFWTDGPGDYQFVLQVTGDQIGTSSQILKATLFTRLGGVIAHHARVDMSQASDLQVARDSVTLTEFHKLKNPEYTICEKNAELIGIRYIRGGLSGHKSDLNVTVRDSSGSVISDFQNMKPGDEVTVIPPIVVTGGIQIDGTMVGGFSGNPPFSTPTPFGPTDMVPWDLEIVVRCF